MPPRARLIVPFPIGHCPSPLSLSPRRPPAFLLPIRGKARKKKTEPLHRPRKNAIPRYLFFFFFFFFWPSSGPHPANAEQTQKKTEHCKKWVHAYRAKRSGDFALTCDLIRELTAGFVAVTDMPPLDFIPELMAVYPEAKVVLVTRDPESWLASIRPVARNSSLDNWLVQYALWPIPGWRHFPALSAEFGTSTREYLGIVDDSVTNPLPCAELLHNWNARVTATVPEDKLLVMELKQGWEPLCGFLGLPVPDEPLPRANDAAAAGEAYREISDRVREIWLNGFAVAGVMGFAAWKTWAVSRQ
ncbi:hypothetical protein MCOR11_004437 [Pyricularia oryzae]|nr:hypothetical protein MCOR11_004437 [Pyricularia oryzae]